MRALAADGVSQLLGPYQGPFINESSPAQYVWLPASTTWNRRLPWGELDSPFGTQQRLRNSCNSYLLELMQCLCVSSMLHMIVHHMSQCSRRPCVQLFLSLVVAWALARASIFSSTTRGSLIRRTAGCSNLTRCTKPKKPSCQSMMDPHEAFS